MFLDATPEVRKRPRAKGLLVLLRRLHGASSRVSLLWTCIFADWPGYRPSASSRFDNAFTCILVLAIMTTGLAPIFSAIMIVGNVGACLTTQ
jgi:hypothetical protein